LVATPNQQKPVAVLIVDDNRDAADSLAILIQGEGLRAAVAYNAMTGFDLARKIMPAIIFHDIGLPIIDGYAAALKVRHDPAFAKTILVALTAYDSDPDRDRALAAGFDLHMVKPIDFADLKRIVALPDKHNC
jgi:CheY-like chemotaxis protein